MSGGMIGLDDDITTPPEQLAKEMDIAKRISEVLMKHYADHLWAVNVDIPNGVANVSNLRLSGNWGFVLHLDKILAMGHKQYEHFIMQCGGEILERYRLARGRYNEDKYSQLHENSGGRLIAEQ